MTELETPLVHGDKVWCPRCGEYVKVVRVAGAAKIVDVDRRTIYNYVKTNKLFAVRFAGSTLRVCTHCLLRENGVEQPIVRPMLEVDDSELTPEYKAYLQEWASELSVSVEVLLGRIVVATLDGFLYVEKMPDYRP